MERRAFVASSTLGAVGLASSTLAPVDEVRARLQTLAQREAEIVAAPVTTVRLHAG